MDGSCPNGSESPKSVDNLVVQDSKTSRWTINQVQKVSQKVHMVQGRAPKTGDENDTLIIPNASVERFCQKDNH